MLAPLIHRPSLIDGLQLLAWLKAHGLAGWDRHLGAGARIATDAGLARPDIEYTKSPQFNAIAFGESCFVNHFINNVELDHERLPVRECSQSTKCLMLREIR